MVSNLVGCERTVWEIGAACVIVSKSNGFDVVIALELSWVSAMPMQGLSLSSQPRNKIILCRNFYTFFKDYFEKIIFTLLYCYHYY